VGRQVKAPCSTRWLAMSICRIDRDPICPIEDRRGARPEPYRHRARSSSKLRVNVASAATPLPEPTESPVRVIADPALRIGRVNYHSDYDTRGCPPALGRSPNHTIGSSRSSVPYCIEAARACRSGGAPDGRMVSRKINLAMDLVHHQFRKGRIHAPASSPLHPEQYAR